MSTVKVSFFLKSRSNHLNQYPIVMTITMGKDRTQVFTGLWIPKTKWDDRTKRVKGRDEEFKTYNDTLLTIQTRIRQITNELLVTGRPFNPNTIKDKFKHGFSQNLGVVESFEMFLQRMEKLIPSKYSKPTLVKYRNTKERVREFIKSHTNRSDIYLYELDSTFMEEFEMFLRNKYEVSHNTIYKTYQRFTRFVRFEVSRGNLDRYPFPDYKLKMVQKLGHYLTFDEIQKLENSVIENPYLLQVKHLFLFCIYTGLSYIDLEKSKVSDLIQDETGMYWLRTYRQKSKSRISVPLISNSLKSLEILRSGMFEIPKGKLLPVKSNVRLNYEIKKVCSLSGIENSHLVTWHSSRRSTSSLMMKMGIPLEILQKVLSHKSLQTSLMYYTHVDDEQVRQSMKVLEDRLNERGLNTKQDVNDFGLN